MADKEQKSPDRLKPKSKRAERVSTPLESRMTPPRRNSAKTIGRRPRQKRPPLIGLGAAMNAMPTVAATTRSVRPKILMKVCWFMVRSLG